MRKTVLVALAAAAAGSALADISTTIVAVQGNPNPNQHTYDLRITVSGGDDWTSSSMKASISGGNFFNSPFGTNTQPNPLLFPLAPELEWDSFVTHPQGWPNTAGQGSAPGLATPPSFMPTTIDVTWYDLLNTGDGTFTIARVTFENLTPGWICHFSGAHTAKNTQGQLLPWQVVCVPEPGTLNLLVLGGLAGLIRRR